MRILARLVLWPLGWLALLAVLWRVGEPFEARYGNVVTIWGLAASALALSLCCILMLVAGPDSPYRWVILVMLTLFWLFCMRVVIRNGFDLSPFAGFLVYALAPGVALGVAVALCREHGLGPWKERTP